VRSAEQPDPDERASPAGPASEWWRNGVVYQIYPRSFQDSDGDGVGDLPGITSRLDHLAWLGVDALWLSPIYPSPLADSGYDVADYTAVDPAYGTLADFDHLLAAAHARGIRVLLDLVAAHTSIEHPWFREHPDWYVWADDGPPNNWRATFGGPAWSLDRESGRWYLHSFYPEQPDLDWRNPEVREAIAGVVGFWRGRGVDGFRVDAVERMVKDSRLRDDPPAVEPFPFPLHPEHAELRHAHSRNDPEIGLALAALRDAAGDAVLVGEVYLPNDELGPYLEHLDVAFTFDFLHSPWEAGPLTRAISSAAVLERVAWVLSNHDFGRIASRVPAGAARAAALLLLTLPGAAFIYQGDEIGMVDGPGAGTPSDRFGRDAYRHPMQWEPQPDAGFSSGRPWLEPVDPARVSVAAQCEDPASMLALYRRLIALRRELGAGSRLLAADPGLIAFERGEHVVAVNLADEPLPPPASGEPVVATAPIGGDGAIPPQAGVVLRGDRGG